MDRDNGEIISQENTLLWILNRVAKKSKRGGRDVTRGHTSTTNGTFQAFSGTEQLSTEAESGPSWAEWRMKNFKVSIMGSWEEDIENSGDSMAFDLFMEKVEKAEIAMGAGLDEGLKSGQVNGSKYFQGLEEAVFAGDPATTTVPQVTRANAFAGADNTYAGISRSPATATTDDKKGWRNLTMDLGDLSATGNIDRFNTDAAVLTTSLAYQSVQRAYNLLSYGSNTPDLILMSMNAYEDYELAHTPFTRFDKGTVGVSGSANLPFETLKFRKAIVVIWENGTMSTLGAASSGNGGTAGADMIYILNTRTWDMWVEEMADFAWTGFYGQPDVLGGVAHLIYRATPRCFDPRRNGVLYNYNTGT